VRALEVCLGSGRPFSSFGPGVAAHAAESGGASGSAVAQIGLRWPRPVLRQRIAQRVERMIDAGLVDEVRAVRARPGGVSR
ncbi:MAG TPA: tRNA dimethylallyltransferase, partial [Ilumatobacteraceae bacterium]|nr:tRNA dimethylallyltransferase [Ilumatobacteraceae bacterium]